MSATEPMVLHRFAAGDTDATRRYALKQNGAALDLTGLTVKLYAQNKTSGVDVSAITGVVISAVGGTVDFDHAAIAASAGEYLCDIETVTGAGKIATCGDTFLIAVRVRAQSVAV